MPPPRPEPRRRAVRWLGAAALLALAPKCTLCVLAYAGLGAALGLGGPEICGAAGPPDAWTTALAWLGAAAGLAALGLLATLRRRTNNLRDTSAGFPDDRLI